MGKAHTGRPKGLLAKRFFGFAVCFATRYAPNDTTVKRLLLC